MAKLYSSSYKSQVYCEIHLLSLSVWLVVCTMAVGLQLLYVWENGLVFGGRWEWNKGEELVGGLLYFLLIGMRNWWDDDDDGLLKACCFYIGESLCIAVKLQFQFDGQCDVMCSHSIQYSGKIVRKSFLQ